MNPYFTHQEYLKKVLNSFDYNNNIKCMEFGTGDGSATVFKEYAVKYKNLKIYSYEFDYNWYIKTKQIYELENYIFNYLEDYFKVDYNKILNDEIFDLIFIDQGNWESRIETLENIKNNSKYIIIHDYDYYNKPITNNIYSIDNGTFWDKYKNDFEMYNYFEILPPTLVMKNKKIK